MRHAWAGVSVGKFAQPRDDVVGGRLAEVEPREDSRDLFQRRERIPDGLRPAARVGRVLPGAADHEARQRAAQGRRVAVLGGVRE